MRHLHPSIVRRAVPVAILGAILLLPACSSGEEGAPQLPIPAGILAQDLAHRILLVDTHVDVPYRIMKKEENISEHTEGGHFDYPRAREGGLDAPFMSIYVPADYQDGGAKEYADQLIDLVEGFAEKWPQKFALAASTAEVRANFDKGILSLPMGMENGAPIEGDLANVEYFHGRGIRYITLTHSRNNHICDSSYAKERQWNGLSPFGRQVVAEMNRVGIMVDISHVTDDAFYQVLEVTKVPVIASHSSARHFTPGFERNMDDDMIKALAENGGVIQINFGAAFLSEAENQRAMTGWAQVGEFLEANDLTWNDPEADEQMKKYAEDHPPIDVPLSEVADHIDHVVQLVGIDHVGIGSDYDGVTSLPVGLEDVSTYPALIAELLRRGHSPDDVEKLLSGNLMRVWAQVEEYAAAQAG